MLPSEKLKTSLKQNITSWVAKFYIMDDNSEWVDFSERLESNGRNLLRKVGTIDQTLEVKVGTGLTEIKTNRIQLDNSDGFFNKPFPSTLKTEKGNTASFKKTKNANISSLYRRKAQIRIKIATETNSIEEITIGTFLIESIQKSLKNNSISIALESLSAPLKKEDSAEIVKDGLSWYENRPIKFLLEELLKPRHQDSTGALPKTFIIPELIEIETADSLAGKNKDNRVWSHFGRPPEFDGSKWRNDGLVCRAHVVAPSTIGGTVAVDQNGKFDKSAYTWNIYLGCDGQLWKFDPDKDKYTEIKDSSGNSLETTLGSDATLGQYYVRRLWHDADVNSPDNYIYGVAWPDPSKSLVFSTELGNNRVVPYKIFKYDGTNFLVLLSSSLLYTGEHCFRVSETQTINSVTTDYIGLGAGENIFLPYTTALFHDTSSTPFFDVFKVTTNTIDDIDPSNLSSSLGGAQQNSGILLEPGYYVAQNLVSPNTFDVRLSYGQQGFFLYHPKIGQKGAFIYTIWNQVSTKSGWDLNIMKYDVNTNVLSTIIYNIGNTFTDAHLEPTCGTIDPNNDIAYLGGVVFSYKNNLVANNQNEILRIQDLNGTPSAGSIVLETGDSRKIPLDMSLSQQTGADLLVSYIDRENAYDRGDIYRLFKVNTGTGVQTEIHRFPGPPMALTPTDSDDNYDTFFIVGGYASMWKYDVSADKVVSLDNGYPAVEQESGYYGPLSIDTIKRSGQWSNIFYTTSRPTILLPEALDGVPEGKYYLAKFDSFVPARIPLADFSGMSRWDAIENIAQVANYIAGFDQEGNFIFINRSLSSSADIVLTNTLDSNIFDIQVSSNEKEVYNHVSINPYIPTINEPKLSWALLKRNNSQSEIDFSLEATLMQLDTKRKSIRLEALSDGKISEKNIRFKYISFDERFETSLSANALKNDETIKISSGIDDIEQGDTLIIYGNDTFETHTVKKDPTAADKKDGIVTLVGGLDQNHFLGDTVEVQKNFSRWSNDVGNIVKDPFFEDWDSAGTSLNQYTVSNVTIAKSTAANEFVFGRSAVKITTTAANGYIEQNLAGVKTNTDYSIEIYMSTDGSSTAFVKIEGDVSSSPVTKTTTAKGFVKLRATFRTLSAITTGVFVRIGAQENGGVVWADGLTIAEGFSVFPEYLVVGAYNTWYPIGNNNMKIKFTTSTPETAFKAGDQIVIEAPGLKLEQQEQSKITVIDSESTAIYGRKEFNEINNRFLTRRLALDLAQRLLNDYKFPHYIITVTASFLPYLNLLNTVNKVTRVDVEDNFFFLARGQQKEICYVRAVSHDISTGRTKFTLRATNPY